MKKAISAVLAVIMCFCLSLGAFAADTQLTTVVPSTHRITITYNDGGYVLYKDATIESGTEITVDRFDDAVIEVICKNDTHLKSVTINGEDVSDELRYGRLSLDDIHTDIDIVFTFERCEDVPPLDPTDPDYNPEHPDNGDKCHHVALDGGVYIGEDPFSGAKMEFDFGEIKTSADKNGKYEVKDIKEGLHTVTISDKDGKPVGKADFAIVFSETAKEITVEKLPDGTQIVTVPHGSESAGLDFIINLDSDGNPDGTITIVPTKPIEDKPGKPDIPIIPITGKLIRENPVITGVIAVSFFFIILFVILRRRREDDEETA